MEESLIFLKKCGNGNKGNTPNGYMGTFKLTQKSDLIQSGKNSTKSFTFSGNLPELYPSMSISISFDDETNKMTGYSVPKSKHNMDVLNKQKIDTEEYFKNISIHQKTQVLWRELKKVTDPYNNYEWEMADLYGHLLHKDMYDTDRKQALVREVRNTMRRCRKEKYEVGDYVKVFEKVEDKGKYEHYPITEVIKTLDNDYFLMDEECYIVDKELMEAHKYNRKSIQDRKAKSKEFLPIDMIKKLLGEEKYNMLSEEQKNVILGLATTSPEIITGGAGSGKTTVIRGILDMLKEFGITDYLLLAPTGRAGERIRETTGEDGYTIHHALGISEDNNYKRFDERNQLCYSVIITDEGSMIDDLLMADLLKATKEDTKLFFVGDKNQLLPVGCGEPFTDFINEGLCDCATLTRNFRQGTDKGAGIARNAENILHGKEIMEDTGLNIFHIKKEDIPKVADCSGNIKVQNISPYNALNDMINDHITENKKTSDSKWYALEKVVALKNTKDYNNGDIGHITNINADGSLNISFYKRNVTVPVDELHNIKPAYSLTVHKCQGSEFEKVNLFIPEKKTGFINIRLLYTAVTRAKECLNVYYYT